MNHQDNLFFQPSSILWRTRGFNWDFEFISIPSLPNNTGWWKFAKYLFKDAGLGLEKQEFYGVIELEKQDELRWYLAAYFVDKESVDWTGRNIQNFLIWFPPGIASENDLMQNVPANWSDQVFFYLSDFIRSSNLFGLSEKQLKCIFRAEKSFGKYLQERYDKEVEGFMLDSNPFDEIPSGWLRRDFPGRP